MITSKKRLKIQDSKDIIKKEAIIKTPKSPAAIKLVKQTKETGNKSVKKSNIAILASEKLNPIQPNKDLLTIQQVADQLGLATKTLRRWEEKGVLKAQRTAGNQRRYTQKDVEMLRQRVKKPFVAEAIPSATPSDNIETRTMTSPSYLGSNFSDTSEPGVTHDYATNTETYTAASLAEPTFNDRQSKRRIPLAIKITSAVFGVVVLGFVGTIIASNGNLSILAGLFGKGENSNFADSSQPDVLADTVRIKGLEGLITFNIPAVFNKNVFIDADATVSGTLTAPNITYRVLPGQNITVSGDPQNPTISTGPIVSSLGGETGDLELEGGTGITINNLEISLTNDSLTVEAGTGLSGGGPVALGGTVTLENDGVLSITGTPNQVIASAATGAVTLSLPQDIHLSASPTFAGATLTDLDEGSVVFAGPGGALSEDNANFFFDDTTNSLGLGTTTPSNTLHVVGTSLVTSVATFTHAPTQPHTFSPWPLGTSNGADASVYINPASAVADSNLLVAAVNGVAKFVVDAEGDIYGNNLILTGSTTTASTTVAGDLFVTGNTTLGDSTTDTITFNARFISDIIPSVANTYNLGSAALPWANLYATNVVATNVSGAITPTGFTQGSVVFAGTGGTLTQDNANFFWDDTNNRLGIGTTSPSVKLHIIDSTAGVTTTARIANLDNTSATSHALLHLQTGGASGGDPYIYLSPSSGTGDFSIGIDNSDSDKLKIATVLGVSGGGEVLTIQQDGNIGIGTTAPGAKVEISGSSAAAPGFEAMRFTNTGAFDGTFISFPRQSDSTHGIVFGHQTGITDKKSSINGCGSVSELICIQAGLNDSAVRGSILLNLSGGNVGVGGDSTPNALFSVGSTSQFQVNSSGQVTYVDGATDTATHVCKNAAGQLSPCNTTGTGAAFVQDGNSFGALAMLGTNDSFGLAFETAGVEKMRILTDGNVGIGTTAPSETLQVRRNSATLSNLVRIDNGTPFTGNTDVAGLVVIGQNSGGSNITGLLTVDTFFTSAATGGVVLRTATAHPLIFGTNNAERMRILSDGNVGIGVTNPSSTLDVVGTIELSSLGTTDTATHLCRNAANQISGCNTTGTGAAFVQGGNTFGALATLGTNDAFGLAFETAGVEKVRILTDGNVGIGTTAPGQKLSIANSSALGWVNAAGSATFQNLIVDGSNDFYIQYPVGQSLYIRDTSGSQKLRVDASGNVGIGTAAPVVKLDVTGNTMLFGSDNVSNTTRTNTTVKNMYIAVPHYTNAEEPLLLIGAQNTSTTNDIFIGNSFSAAANTATSIRFATAATNTTTTGTERMRIDNNGNVGIGDSSPLYLLTVGSGDLFGVNSSGNIVWEGATADAFELTLTPGDIGQDTTITLPNPGVATDTICLLTLGNCFGSGTGNTLQAAYNADADGSDAIIALTTADDSLIFRNPASAGTDSTYLLTLDQLATGTTGGLFINSLGADANFALRVDDSSGDTTPFVIDNTGNVGIGTNGPNQRLHILGNLCIEATDSGCAETLANTGFVLDGNDAFVGGMLGVEGAIYSDTGLTVGASTTYADGSIQQSGSTFDFLTNGNTDTLNIGDTGTTVNIPGTLTVAGTGSSTFSGNITITKADPALIYNVATATDTDFWAGVTDDAGGDNDDLYQIGLGTTPGTTPYLTINQAGNVGIGVTNPGGLLHVAGQCVTGDTLLKRRKKRKGSRVKGKVTGPGPDPDLDENSDVILGGSRISNRSKENHSDPGLGQDDEYYYEDVRIDEIQPGDVVLTLDEKTGEFVPQIIEKFMEMGEQEVLKLYTRSGLSIQTTTNHPYLVKIKDNKPQIVHMGGTYEVDQSNRIEQFDKDTFIAIANSKSKAVIKLSKEVKKKLYREFIKKLPHMHRQTRIKLFAPDLFARAIALLLSRMENQPAKLIIDLEYPGYNDLISRIILTDFKKQNIEFKSIGKKSVAHLAAHSLGGKKLKHKKTTVEPFEGTIALLHPEFTGIRRAHGLFSNLYHKSGNLSTPLTEIKSNLDKKQTKWIEAKLLRPGMIIATLKGFEPITTIYNAGRKETYDIQIATTHNFVGNGIVAHNTLLATTTGNVGIGDTTPLYLLTVGSGDLFGVNSSGNIVWEGATADAFELTLTPGDIGQDTTITLPNPGVATDTICLLTLGNCFGSGTGNTLQAAYNAGNTITTTDARDIEITLADTATDQSVEITQAGTALALRVNDDGTFTDSTPFVIDASGNVGIGTTAPGKLLHLASAARTDMRLERTGTGVAAQEITAFQLNGGDSLGNSTTYGQIVGISVSPTDGAEQGQLNFEVMDAGAIASRMTIRGGNLGIADTTPTSKLDILPTGTFGAAGISGIAQQAHTVTLSGADPTTYATFHAAQIGAMTLSGTNPNQTVTNAAGLVVAPPIKSTNVALTNTHGILIPATAVSTATNAFGLTVNAPTGATNNYTAAFLGGNVGIGTTGPDQKLHLLGNLCVEATDTGCAETLANTGFVLNGDDAFIGGTLGVEGTIYSDSGLLVGASTLYADGSIQQSGSTFDFLTNGNTDTLNIGDAGTTVNIPGTLTVAGTGSSTFSGNITIQKADPTLIYDVITATDTDYWAGVTDDADGVNDDLYQIGLGTTPGTTPYLTINQAGNVGIGTTAPNQKLEVAGIGRFTDTNGFSIGGDTGQKRIQTSGANDQLFAFLNASNSFTGARMKALSIGGTFGSNDAPASGLIVEGNVGIGTTAPAAKLSVNGSGTLTGLANIGDNSAGSILSFLRIAGSTAPSNGLVGIDLQPTISSNTGASFRGMYVKQTVPTGVTVSADLVGLYLDSPSVVGTVSGTRYGIYQADSASLNYFNGNVGIGTTAPSRQLQVATSGQIGSVVIGDTTASNLQLLVTSDGAGTSTIRNWASLGALQLWGGNSSSDPVISLYGRQNAAGVGITIDGASATTDVPVRNLTITGTSALASAVTNLVGADVIINGGAKATAGGTDGDVILANTRGNVGIGGDTTPDARLSVGATSQFQVNSTGNLTRINDIAYSWPASQGAADTILQNNGSGTLTWGTIGASGITANSLDFTEFQDIMDLDAALVLNQGTNNWTQNFDGTTGDGLIYNVDSLTSGNGIKILSDPTTVSSAFTGNRLIIADSSTYTGGVGLNSTGNLFDATRSITLNNTGNTLTISGAVAELSDSATVTAGTLTHSADVLRVRQTYTSNTGAALNVSSAGTGLVLRVNDDGNFTDSTPFVVDATGNVGIGTTAPGAKFHVNRDDTSRTELWVENDRLTAATEIGLLSFRALDSDSAAQEYSRMVGLISSPTAGAEEGQINFETVLAGAVAPRVTIKGGNVGIGTTAPTTKLHVIDAKTTALNTGAAWNTVGLRIEDSTAFATGVGGGLVFVGKHNTAGTQVHFAGIDGVKENATDGNYAGALRFHTTTNGNSIPIERMRIDSVGNVGIGTTAPGGKLEVVTTDSTAAIYQMTKNALTVSSSNAFQKEGARNQLTWTGTSAQTGALYGNYNLLQTAGSGAVTVAYGVRNDLQHSNSSGVLTTGYGTYNTVIGSSSTAITNAYGSYNLAQTANASGVITNAYGGAFKVTSALSGAITTGYGVYIDTPTATGTYTTNYGLYVADQTGPATTYAAVFAGGNVGIGTIAPLFPLEVVKSGSGQQVALSLRNANGVANDSTALNFDWNVAQGPVARIEGILSNAAGGGSGGLIFSTRNGGSTTQKMSILADGNVGIGITNPASKLVVSNAGAEGLEVAVSTGNVILSAYDRLGSNYEPITIDSSTFRWRPSGSASNNFVIDSIGNVGIGSNSPGMRLRIDHSTTSDGGDGIQINSTADEASYTSFGSTINLNHVPGISNPTNTNKVVGSLLWKAQANDASYNLAQIRAIVTDDNTAGARLDTKGALDFFTKNSGSASLPATPQMRIAADGNVGIGTTGPSKLLDVQGEVQINLASTQTAVALCGSHSALSGAAVSDVTIVDCSGVPAADYMEFYSVQEDAQQGDIVAPGSTTITTKDGDNIAKLTKSTSAYQTNVIGIVSDKSKAGDFNSIGYNIKDEDNPQPIALSGRVPVRVATDSPAIQAGDYITTSNQPGRAMKATTAGQMIGKALEAWTPGSNQETVMVFVTTSYADPNNALANLNFDESGNLILPSITPDEEVTQLGGTSQLPGSHLGASKKDLGWSLADIVRRLTKLEEKVASGSAATQSNLSATDSAKLDILTGRVDGLDSKASTLSSDLSSLNSQLSSRIASLEADLALFASASATLSTSSTASSAAELGIDRLDAKDAVITKTLSVGGRTTLSDVGITGKMNIGLLAIEGLSENGFATLNTTSGPLKIQSDGLNSVDILDGKVVIEPSGNMKVDGAITVKKVNVDISEVASASLGTGTIIVGQTKVTIKTSALTSKSKIFAQSIDSPVATAVKATGADTFEIKIPTIQTTDIKLNWWVVN